MDPRFDSGIFAPARPSTDTPAKDPLGIHKDTPALPFCQCGLKSRKTKGHQYPSEIKTWRDHVRVRRLDLGLMQKEVALMLGVEKATVSNWETNRSKPVVRFLPRIVEFLGYSPHTRPMSFGEGLRMHRMDRGLSQKKLANQLGVDESSIRNWEAKRGRPTRRSLEILRRFLGASELTE